MERLAATRLRPDGESRIENAMKNLENPFLVEFKADLAQKQPQFQEDKELLRGASAALLLGENYPLGHAAGKKLLQQMDRMEGDLLVRLAEFLEALRAQWMAEKLELQKEVEKYSDTAQDALKQAESYQAKMLQLDKTERELDKLRNLRAEERRRLKEAELEKADLLALLEQYRKAELPQVEKVRLELEALRDEHWVAMAELRRQCDKDKQELVNQLDNMRREKHDIMQHDDSVIFKQAEILSKMNDELAKAIGEAHWLEEDNQRMYNALAAGQGDLSRLDEHTPRPGANQSAAEARGALSSVSSGQASYDRVNKEDMFQHLSAGPRGVEFWKELIPATIRALSSVPLPPESPFPTEEVVNTKIQFGFEPPTGGATVEVNVTAFYPREMDDVRRAIAFNSNDQWIINELVDRPLLAHEAPQTGLTMWSPEGHLLVKKTSANYAKPLLSRQFMVPYVEYFRSNARTTFMPHLYYMLKITIPDSEEEAFFVISNNPVMTLRSAGLTAKQRYYIRGNQTGGDQPTGDDLNFLMGPQFINFAEQDAFLRGISLDLDFVQQQGMTDYGLLVALVDTPTIPPLPRIYANPLMQGFTGEDAGGKTWGILIGMLDVHNKSGNPLTADTYADNFFEAMEMYFPADEEADEDFDGEDG
ncbi:unnamed protein product [Amoebophrya sp. A120]|nr:unnamed protein product [Amoebophrya sp. A120]|eukprot:GSA120T00021668001.1